MRCSKDLLLWGIFVMDSLELGSALLEIYMFGGLTTVSILHEWK